MIVISIVGRSDAGKTTLIERLIPVLQRRGLRVGTIKHDAHRFEMDYPGKDTYRHFAAGAQTVLIASAEKLALQKRLAGPMPLDEIVEHYFDDVDLVLTEGYKSGDKPKIEVFRAERGDGLLCGETDNLIAVVTDAEMKLSCPRFGLNQVEAVADYILGRFFSKKVSAGAKSNRQEDINDR